MSHTPRESPARHPEARWYEIRVQGHLDARWSDRFDGLSLTQQRDGTTLLEGRVPDQSALHGLLQRVRDTGLPLLSVKPVDPEQTTDPRTD